MSPDSPGILGRLFGSRSRQPRVGLFVDGPNVFREEFDVDLDAVRNVGEEYGRIVRATVYLDEHATPGLIRASEARGFEVVVTSGDVDVKLAVEATAQASTDSLDVVVVVSRDTDFKPLLETVSGMGVKTVAIAPGEHGRADALKNTADETLVLGAE